LACLKGQLALERLKAMNTPLDHPSPKNHPPIGIDLGTTFSVVASVDATGRPITILNSHGETLTPSAIALDEGELIVGKEAIKLSVFSPSQFAECIKRDMGRPAFHRAIIGKEVPPEVLSGFILQRLKKDTEQRLGQAINEVVITVPAFFDETRRKATQDAGRLAGLKVLDIINEPTAAAIAFGYHRKMISGVAANTTGQKERVLVFDLGGGTFDVTILELDGQTFRTLATDGDVQLGGMDFDQRLVNLLADRFLAEHGADPRSDPSDSAQLWRDAQDAKHTLSERSAALVVVTHAGIRLREEITRTEFEGLASDLLQRIRTTTALVLRQAHIKWDDIDRVLLVGGSTRMPMVVEMLRQLSGKEPDRTLSADEVVAHGAALYAAMLRNPANEATGSCLVNVNSHSLGLVGIDVRTDQRVNAILIPKNTPLPYRKRKRCETARDHQTTIKVEIVEGESHRPEECIPLGTCVIHDLPPNLPKGTRVDVEFCYAANGRVSVEARVPSVRQSVSMEIQRGVKQDFENLEVWRKRLCYDLSTELATISSASESSSASDNQSSPEELARRNRLEQLYAEIGALVLKSPAPPHLVRQQQLAQQALDALGSAQAAVREAELQLRSAVGAHELARQTADVTSAELATKGAETALRYAVQALGRDCMESQFLPPGSQRLASEIVEIRQFLKI
jgi:molecular chaperone DnaK